MTRPIHPLLALLTSAALSVASLEAKASTTSPVPLHLTTVEQRSAGLQPRLVEWRRDFHRHPELSGQEERTARKVAEHLRSLGLEVTTGVGGHGVVGLLKGALPGKVVALRADMDALPVVEETDLPFASRVVADYMGKPTPVMHACGHDGHTAILMGVAELLSQMRSQLKGTVKFIFQPAEEGIPDSTGAREGASWGAKAMIEQGVLQNPRVDAIFGLHINPGLPSGSIGYRSGPLMAGADEIHIHVEGKQAHGASPWNGVDPIVVSSQIILGLQTIVSRQLNISQEPAVISIGAIAGGNRSNIVPESVKLLGTLRTFDEPMRNDAKQRIARTANLIAESAGARAKVNFGPLNYSVTTNDASLTEASLPVLNQMTGNRVSVIPKRSASEDFSEYQRLVPGMFFLLGAMPEGKSLETVAPNHSPKFDFNEDAMAVGVRSLSALAIDYLNRH
ncbi:amidohydrolase [Variovorax paradoxus]|jgi:amidohydrolase|uniref:Amidohydrolase n=1 Tax=Variovorax paradoxus (strain S110) TaxID=543728 RepID=C5D0C5_VARPS